MLIYEGKAGAKAYVMIDDIDPETVKQIYEFLNHPFFAGRDIIIMPDTHKGKGCVIGFTMVMPSSMIIPNIVGVDGSCGMIAVNLGQIKALNRAEADDIIRAAIPFGFEVHGKKPLMNMERQFPWKQVTEENRRFVMAFNKRFNKQMILTEYTYEWFQDKCKEIDMDARRANNSLGTLGGGNHFIEFGADEVMETWLTVHSGSRQFGERVCRYWQTQPVARERKKAEEAFREELKTIKLIFAKKKDRIHIPKAIQEAKAALGLNKPYKGKELDHISDHYMEGYLTDMIFVHAYAQMNRQLMINRICEVLEFKFVQDRIETVHNYIDFNDFIIRKGAVASYEGMRMIIPFNMEDGLLICEGKSNPDWNFSAPHGAGRLWARGDAKRNKEFSSEKVMERMKESDIYTSAVPVDEIKEVYKDPKVIEEAIEPTAKILNRVKPFMNLKSVKPEKGTR